MTGVLAGRGHRGTHTRGPGRAKTKAETAANTASAPEAGDARAQGPVTPLTALAQGRQEARREDTGVPRPRAQKTQCTPGAALAAEAPPGALSVSANGPSLPAPAETPQGECRPPLGPRGRAPRSPGSGGGGCKLPGTSGMEEAGEQDLSVRVRSGRSGGALPAGPAAPCWNPEGGAVTPARAPRLDRVVLTRHTLGFSVYPNCKIQKKICLFVSFSLQNLEGALKASELSAYRRERCPPLCSTQMARCGGGCVGATVVRIYEVVTFS